MICLCDVVRFVFGFFCVYVGLGFTVFACFVCELLCDGVWCGVICFVCSCVLGDCV